MAEYGEDGLSGFSRICFIFMRETIELLKIYGLIVKIF
jgi:hypothetical protein